MIGADGGPPRRLTDDPAEDDNPRWSRDGRWIYFHSNRSGEDQIWKIPAEGGEAVQVTKQGGMGGVIAFESLTAGTSTTLTMLVPWKGIGNVTSGD